MSDTEIDPKKWWMTLPGFLTALAALLSAGTGMFVAVHQTPRTPVHSESLQDPSKAEAPSRKDPCVDLPFEERPVSCLERK
jgi:hypothetical protein